MLQDFCDLWEFKIELMYQSKLYVDMYNQRFSSTLNQNQTYARKLVYLFDNQIITLARNPPFSEYPNAVRSIHFVLCSY